MFSNNYRNRNEAITHKTYTYPEIKRGNPCLNLKTGMLLHLKRP